ncbi:hypothetical protein AMD27_16375 (plasmid) [Acinetobacter sp. TGL-Y2]|uniref:hypothetical protein n=1 Tax=Acinetobacter sp. TGL-Y2 TaxID=1407071 RepID=UPI0007A6674C|nr:hypothetical protein [Acinetobacter sp. TGL-Y2]AMW80492.1 hypothetical protein AMD27_16375 [Acinetobacter sp. TGL-Y2]
MVAIVGLKNDYDLKYLHEVVEYGKYIEAEAALMKDGGVYLYYKRGNKESKYCAYNFDPNDTNRLYWKNSSNTCYFQAFNFYVNIGWKVDLISISEIVLPPLPD